MYVVFFKIVTGTVDPKLGVSVIVSCRLKYFNTGVYSDVSRVFWADRYIHQTQRVATTVGAEGKILKNASRCTKNALSGPVSS